MANEMTRASIPSEFYDITSPMLLTAPIPQFLHAKFIVAAVNAALNDTGEAIALPIPGRDVPQGAYDQYKTLEQLELELSNPLPRQVIQVVNDFRPDAKTPGHTVRYNRPRFTNTTHTAASREVPAGTVIGTAAVSIQGDQVPLTVKRYAGPYNTTSGAPGPFAIDVFDASRSLHSFVKIVDQQFKYDYHKSLDTWAVSMYDQAPTANIVYGGGATADNDLSAENSHPMDWRLLKRTARLMDDANVPRMADGKPDLSGMWYVIPLDRGAIPPVPMQKWADDMQKELNRINQQGPAVYCLPQSAIPTTLPFPYKFVQTHDLIVHITEFTTPGYR